MRTHRRADMQAATSVAPRDDLDAGDRRAERPFGAHACAGGEDVPVSRGPALRTRQRRFDDRRLGITVGGTQLCGLLAWKYLERRGFRPSHQGTAFPETAAFPD